MKKFLQALVAVAAVTVIAIGCNDSSGKSTNSRPVVDSERAKNAPDKSQMPAHLKNNPRAKMMMEGGAAQSKKMHEMQKEANKTGKPPANPYK